jgi:SET domain-containing protein
METRYQHCVGQLKFINPQKGWGVVATRRIQVGETVEIVPIVRLFRAITDRHLNLKHRVFDWEALGGRAGETALALGYGSMYNHRNPANLRYSAIHDGSSSALVYIAARDIAAGEELTINYNDTKGETTSTQDNWFEERGVTPLP